MTSIITIWDRSVTAELSWLSPAGPVGVPVVPLVLDGHPCVALPFAHLALADTLTDGRAALSVTDARALPTGSAAATATGPVRVTHDLDGEVFVEALLEQEARKHPPTRQRAGGLLARRENWWWVPRVLVTLLDAAEERPLPTRTGAADALLVRAGARGPAVDVVSASEWPDRRGARIGLRRLDGEPLEAPGGDGYVFSHHHSPDFGVWERWHRRGRLEGATLTVADAAGGPAEPVRPPGLWARLRAHRDVAGACRRGIAAAEARAAGLRR
ncbi:hypothetical protein NI17_004650 [Thermobifida halotolerans]|uniref:Uncharacterized protein n=1 Tax=Thermobifida halotolerans TaxID=483545 RepID=A0AA97M4P0_9ACTN|nr:hypothetical protein [Thermobifida halotolerans]UOE20519.1 hypothetical protein NI17_004650 [Thermobifida halotolerans]